MTTDPYAASARIRFRRAVVLMLMTLVLPGSAQLVSGRRSVGRLALRIWLALLVTVVAVLLLGVAWRGFGFWFVLNTGVLSGVRFLLMGLAVGWAYLFVDAWMLGDPLALRRQQRLAMVGINGVLCFSVAGTLLFASHVVTVQRDFIATMFAGTASPAATTAATTCSCSEATRAPTAGACAPTASRSPASTPGPVRRCCSGCPATCSTSRSPRAR
ncbi:MAG: hypothetical protein ACTHJH_16390 [Marmoricola sp.]